MSPLLSTRAARRHLAACVVALAGGACVVYGVALPGGVLMAVGFAAMAATARAAGAL